MVLASLSLLLLTSPSDGLSRVLDSKTRRYSVHLEIDDHDSASTSDFEIVLSPKKAKKDEPAGSYFLKLMNLRWSAGDINRRQATFGSGTIFIGAEGLPTGVISTGLSLSPLLSFYVPGSEGRISTDNPVSEDDIGLGWRLKGTMRMGLVTTEGQGVQVDGQIQLPNGTSMSYSSKATMNADSGWPVEASGSIQGPKFSETYTIKAKS